MSDSIQSVIIRELQLVLEPIVSAASSEYRRTRLFAQLGWDINEISGFPLDRLDTSLRQIVAGYDAIAAAVDDPPDTLPELLDLLEAARNAFEALRGLSSLLQQPGSAPPPPPQFNDLGRDLLHLLVLTYLERYHTSLYRGAALLTLIVPPVEAPEATVVIKDNVVVRRSQRRGQLRIERISSLIRDPVGILTAEYFDPTKPLTVVQANAAADRFFPRLAQFLETFGVETLYGGDPSIISGLGPDGAQAGHTLTMRYRPVDATWEAGVTLSLSSQETGGLGLVIAPFGTLAATEQIGDWVLSLSSNANAGAISYGPSGVTVISGNGGAPTRVAADLGALRLPDSSGGPAIVIGDRAGSRLELGAVEVGLKLAAADGGTFEFGVIAAASKAAIVVAAPSGDGFLGKLFPRDGLRTDFDFGMGWATGRGLYLSGSAGLEANLPLNLSLGGVIQVDTLRLGLRASDQGLQLVCELDPNLRLGPVAASVRGIGLAADIAFPDGGGNIGPADLKLGVKPPTGAGLSVDAGGITGGGFIDLNRAEQRYAGILTLNFGEIGLDAVGLITTKLPSGKPGFSMLVIIGVQFSPPIQLSFGFTLSGVGGLIGINRTMEIEALRSGLKQHTLDSILFPENPILNAAKIINDLGTVFPAEEGRFIVGPMVKIGWGSPNVIQADIAIVIELPDPIRIVLLGQIAAAFPSRENAKIVLHLDVLGVLEPAKKSLAIDATLYDSRILSYPLSGDAAMRLTWGDKPQFALSLGGFHPRFDPPPKFPDLRRLKLDLSQNGSLQLACTAYHALTSNSLQFGARVDLYAEAGGASLDGTLTFDALIYFSPFAFEVDMSGSVVARYKGRRLAGVRLRLTLSGPNPWHAKGSATFEILAWDVKARFDRSWGSERVARLDPINAWDQFVVALDRKGSWGTVLPPGAVMVDALHPAAGTPEKIPVHPAGMIEIRQHVLPLDMKLDTLGNAPIAGPRRFSLGALTARQNGVVTDLRGESVQDFFARAQFEEMTDKKRLSLPAFERMPAGVRATGPSLRLDGKSNALPLKYETILIHREGQTEVAPRNGQVTWQIAQRLTRGNAARHAALRGLGGGRYRPPRAGPLVKMADESYVIVEEATLARPVTQSGAAVSAPITNRLKTDQLLSTYSPANPAQRFIVMAASEVP